MDLFSAREYIKGIINTESIETCEKVPLPMVKDDQNYIFISYAHRDYKEVYADLAEMYEAGVRFWYDRGLPAGKDWDQEVKERIENPNCIGVIFYLSQNLFLSQSVNKEIDYTCNSKNDNEDGATIGKNYFCVNLTDFQPKDILKAVMRMDDDVLEKSGIDMDRIVVLGKAFKDQTTYIRYSDKNHVIDLLNQIRNQFNVIDDEKVFLGDGEYSGDFANGLRHGYGICAYPDGSSYDGEWKNDLFDGKGKRIYSNGSIYEGNWVKGKRSGFGKYATTTGFFYEGEWEDDAYNGKGKENNGKGQIIEGVWKKGKLNGQASVVFDNGDSYIGEFIDGVKNGHGIYRWESGKTFEGDYKDGQENGYAVIRWPDGDYYDGFLQNGKYHGKGHYYTSHSEYDGEWKNGKKDGYGTIKFESGASYDGEWQNDEFSGEGTFVFSSGRKYSGHWENSKQNGYGVMIDDNGERYEGNWLNDKKDGFGIATLSNGNKYEGYWKNDKKHGKGCCYLQNGEKYEGEWESNHYSGEGIFYYLSGSVYKGKFNKGKRNGYGVLESNEGIYYGFWKDDTADGKGKIVFPDGAVFEGIWKAGDLVSGKGTYRYGDGIEIQGCLEDGKLEGLGKQTWPDGKIYEGEFKNGNSHGKGKLILPQGTISEGVWSKGYLINGTIISENGQKYIGELSEGKYNGHGEKFYLNGNHYVGEWKEGKKHGLGKMEYECGDSYEGEWECNTFWGNGRYNYADGDYYEGEYVDGVACGSGVFYYAKTKDKYEGEWTAGKKNGNGTYYFANGDKYEGNWKYGLKSGLGKFEWADGTVYEGEWKGDVKAGKGKITYVSGDYYEGDWVRNKKTGKGKYVWKDGSIYEGEFLNGNSEGFGVAVYNDGSRYEGEWKDDKKHGKGIMVYDNGEIYDGEWRYGYRNGRGNYLYKTGKVYSGSWKADDKEGQGITVCSSGEFYKGKWVKGEKDGEGTAVVFGNEIRTEKYAYGSLCESKTINNTSETSDVFNSFYDVCRVAIDLLEKSVLSSKTYIKPQCVIKGKLGEQIIESDNQIKRRLFVRRAFLLNEIIGYSIILTPKSKEKTVLKYCKEISREMEAFLTLEHQPNELISIYYEGYRYAIEQLISTDTKKTNSDALKYCKKVYYTLTTGLSTTETTNTMLELNEHLGHLYSKSGNHNDSIVHYELAENTYRNRLSSETDNNAEWFNLIHCCTCLAEEHLSIEHLELGLKYRQDAVDLCFQHYNPEDVYDFRVFINARNSLAETLGKTNTEDASQKEFLYRAETIKLINEHNKTYPKHAQDTETYTLLEYYYILQLCENSCDRIDIDDQIRVLEEYVENTNNNKNGLHKGYALLSVCYAKKGDTEKASSYSNLANN